jgi:hypothetical protein
MAGVRLPRTAGGCAAVAFGCLAAVYLLSPVVAYGDGRNAGPTAASIVTEGDLDIDEFADLPFFGGYQTVFVDGRAYDWYPWTRSLFAVPVAAAAEVASAAGVGDGAAAAVRSATWEPLLLLVPGALATAAAAALSGAVAWRYSGAGPRRSRTALLVALGTGLATGYWSTSSRGMWQHGPACLWFTVALLATWHVAHGRRRAWAAAAVGAGATAAAFTRPTFVILGVALALWMALVHRDRLAPAAAGALAVAVPVVLVDLAAFGEPLMPYYDASRRSAEAADPLAYGLAATLLSPSRGMAVFLPLAVGTAVAGLVVGSRGRDGADRADRSAAALRWCLAAGAVAVIAFSATNPEGWWAGHSYGPRFAVDVVPVLALLAVPAVDRIVTAPIGRPLLALTAVAAGWSVLVHAQGAIVRQTTCWNARPTDIDEDRARVWDWADTQSLTGIRWVLGGNSPLRTDCGAGREDELG